MQGRNGALRNANAQMEASKGMHWAYAFLIVMGSTYMLGQLGVPLASWLFTAQAPSYNQLLLQIGVALLWDQFATAFGTVLWIHFTITRYYEIKAWANYSYIIAIGRPLIVFGSSYSTLDRATVDALPGISYVFLATIVLALVFGIVYVRRSVRKARAGLHLVA